MREENDDEDAAVTLAAIPAADETAAGNGSGRRPKRARRNTETETGADRDAGDQQNSDVEIVSDGQEGEEDELFVHDDPDDDVSTRSPPAKRRRGAAAADSAAKAVGDSAQDDNSDDDKKKLAMDISYEGFSIYGRVLCLVVKRRDGNIGSGPQQTGRGRSTPAAGGSHAHATKPGGGGQAMMENFIISTQIPAGAEMS